MNAGCDEVEEVEDVEEVEEVEEVEDVEDVEEVDTALAHAFCKDIVKASWTALGAKSVN